MLFNIWDVGSAKAVESAGARALATGSWSVAKANGYEDGERVPPDLVIENLRRIARATDLPVTIDLESGYGRTPEAVGRTVERSIEAGAVGCNLEDSEPGSPDDEETYGGGSRRRSYLDPPRATATMGLTLWSPWLFLLLQIAIAKIAPSRTLRTSR